jgi:hypothetical protein
MAAVCVDSDFDGLNTKLAQRTVFKRALLKIKPVWILSSGTLQIRHAAFDAVSQMTFSRGGNLEAGDFETLSSSTASAFR